MVVSSPEPRCCTVTGVGPQPQLPTYKESCVPGQVRSGHRVCTLLGMGLNHTGVPPSELENLEEALSVRHQGSDKYNWQWELVGMVVSGLLDTGG